MSNKNYKDYRKAGKPDKAPEVEEKIPEQIIKETGEVEGMVCNCDRLNIRSEASIKANVVGVIEKGTKVTVDLAWSIGDFYKVRTSEGLEGFCMLKYITIKL